MNITQKGEFKRAYKRLYDNQFSEVNSAIETIINNPLIGEEKLGDLVGVRVLKFSVVGQQFLLAYKIFDNTICLLALGVHENFYRDLKRKSL